MLLAKKANGKVECAAASGSKETAHKNDAQETISEPGSKIAAVASPNSTNALRRLALRVKLVSEMGRLVAVRETLPGSLLLVFVPMIRSGPLSTGAASTVLLPAVKTSSGAMRGGDACALSAVTFLSGANPNAGVSAEPAPFTTTIPTPVLRLSAELDGSLTL